VVRLGQTSVLPLIRRWWSVLALAGLVCGLGAHGVVSRVHPTYESTEQLLTGPVNTDFDTQRAAGQLARTYAELSTTRPLLQAVADEVGVAGGADKLKPKVQVTASTVSRLITIVVQDRSAQRATQAATSISRRLQGLEQQGASVQNDAVERLMSRHEIAELPVQIRDSIRAAAVAVLVNREAGRLTVVDPATVPTDPVGPRKALLTLLAALAGTISAGVLILLRSIIRDTVDSEERLAELTPFPFLGSVKAFAHWGRGAVRARALTKSPHGDRYRLLAAKIGLTSDPPRVGRLLVIAADARSGGSAIGLAAAAAAAGVSVVLVDADERNRRISRLFGLAGRRGCGELLSDGRDSDQARVDGVRVTVDPWLDLIPAGTARGPAATRAAIASLMETLSQSSSEVVMVAGPPLTEAAASIAWVQATDACLLVARRHRTSAAAVSDVSQALSFAGATVVGTVLIDGRKRMLAHAERTPSVAKARKQERAPDLPGSNVAAAPEESSSEVALTSEGA
jgi:capsular polysaccharide biosynthesis protein/Mrp family chromosome partitioning ATPase